MNLSAILQIVSSAIIFLLVHISEHWRLLIMSFIYAEFHLHLQDKEMSVFLIESYLCLFYGKLLGSLFWKQMSEIFEIHSNIIISLTFLALSTYFQAYFENFKAFLFFVFLNGFSLNSEAISKRLVSKFVVKNYRQQAIFSESFANTFGTLSGPIFGLVLFAFSGSFFRACFDLAIIILISMCLYIISFILLGQKKSKKPKKDVRIPNEEFSLEDEKIPFKRFGTVISPSWKEGLVHAFWTNRISSRLLVIYMTNSACFHLSLVLTASFFTYNHVKGEFDIDRKVIGIGNLIGGFGSLFSIYYFSRHAKNLYFYKGFMLSAISINAIAMVVCPFIKTAFVHFSRTSQHVIIVLFIIFKEFVSVYLYNHILQKLIMVSIHKVYRKEIVFVLAFVKAISIALIFTLAMPFFYFTLNEPGMVSLYPFNFAVCFWIVAFLQLSTLPFFKYMEMPLTEF